MRITLISRDVYGMFMLILIMVLDSAVRYQMKLHGKSLKDGDVLMTNSPRAGGS